MLSQLEPIERLRCRIRVNDGGEDRVRIVRHIRRLFNEVSPMHVRGGWGGLCPPHRPLHATCVHVYVCYSHTCGVAISATPPPIHTRVGWHLWPPHMLAESDASSLTGLLHGLPVPDAILVSIKLQQVATQVVLGHFVEQLCPYTTENDCSIRKRRTRHSTSMPTHIHIGD